VSASKMGTEPVFGNAIAAVSTAFVPGAVLMLPMLRAMIFPGIVAYGMLFVHFPRAFLAVVRLPMRFVALLDLMFPLLLVAAIAIRVVRGRGGVVLVPVRVPVLVPVFLLGSILRALVFMLRADKGWAAKNES